MRIKDVIPKQVKVGAYTFQINAKGRNWFLEVGDYGQMLPESLEINLVAAHRKPIIILDTLIHEILHAIWYVWNLEDKDDEERVVRSVSTAWVGVLRDNPDLLTFQNAVLADYHPQQ